MQSKFNLMVFIIASIFLLGLVSAQNTLVFGKVYKNSDVSDTGVIAGATVTAICGGVTLAEQTSTSEGYVFLFSDAACKDGDSVTVKAVIDNWKGQDVGTARPCDSSSNCDDVSASYVAVANPILVEQKTSSGGSKKSSGSGGGIVIAKPVNKTNVTVVKTVSTNVTVVNNTLNDSIVLDSTNVTDESDSNDLTGVTGFSILGGSGSWISVIILLVIVVIVILIIRSVRNRK